MLLTCWVTRHCKEYSFGCALQRWTFHGVRLPKELWKCSLRRLYEDNPLDGVPLNKSKFLVSCTRTCHDPVGHTSNSTVTTCADGTTEHTEDEGSGVNIRCSSASALFRQETTMPRAGTSRRTSIREKFSRSNPGQSRMLWLREAARKQRETRRRGRLNIRIRFPEW